MIAACPIINSEEGTRGKEENRKGEGKKGEGKDRGCGRMEVMRGMGVEERKGE